MQYFIPLLLVCATTLFGCGPSGPAKAQVNGKVTLDGNPMPEGEIHFIELGGPPDVLKISDGSFKGEVTVGKKRVEIYAYREVPPPPTATEKMTASKENYIPAQYNSNSKMEADITKDGENEFTFAIQSKGVDL